MLEKVAQTSQFRKILKEFPGNLKFCFAYGSGVFKQRTDPSHNLLDLIFVVRNPYRWHEENMRMNPDHYAQPLRLLGHRAVTRVQEYWSAKVYYNTLIKSADGRGLKYGVVSEISLIEDLLDWDVLYLAGRLHKPVEVIVQPYENSQLGTALTQNLRSAVHTALLLLPEFFNEIQFFKTVSSLSYNGDFRMIFGEDKNKVSNIVLPQLDNFRELYGPTLRLLDQYVDISQNGTCRQDPSPQARLHHLNQLPRIPQLGLVRRWSQGPRSQDTEDCLRAIAYDLESGEILDRVLRDVVWRSSVSQSLKGIVTAGLSKSVRYSWEKVCKMLNVDPKCRSLVSMSTLVTNYLKRVRDDLKRDKMSLPESKAMKK